MTQEQFEALQLKLVSGVGDYESHQACIMSAAVAKHRLMHGEDLGKATDELECVCPVVRSFAIALNDLSWWDSDEERTQALMPFVDKILNTRNPELVVKRAYLCADRAMRVFAPMALEATGFKAEADKLRACAPIVDPKSAKAASWASEAARAASLAA